MEVEVVIENPPNICEMRWCNTAFWMRPEALRTDPRPALVAMTGTSRYDATSGAILAWSESWLFTCRLKTMTRLRDTSASYFHCRLATRHSCLRRSYCSFVTQCPKLDENSVAI